MASGRRPSSATEISRYDEPQISAVATNNAHSEGPKAADSVPSLVVISRLLAGTLDDPCKQPLAFARAATPQP